MHISLMEYEDNSEDEDEDDEDDDDDQVQDVDAARSRTESNMPPPLARSFTANNAISPDPDLSPLASRKPLPSISAENGDSAHPPRPPPPPLRSHSAAAYLSSSGFFGSPIPATPGARLIPSLTFESSDGEQDKHVLKNGGKVGKFVQDMNCKVAEEQLLCPNPQDGRFSKEGIPAQVKFTFS
ncbi:hypothetical protein A4X13_0g3276 [Tilletia indica]|uniref:Uncharacterized protein n=1 Tax=Tilletia indica TaxID=43049 RepID=A0A8T8T2H4_9BASI|nr:hypothetical protein A4X13_0g3276 [Tilletia indica]